MLRAAILVAFGAFLQAVLAPQLSLWWVEPNFLVLALAAAVAGLRELYGVLLGFFGGILVDILASGLFGAGAFGGAIVGMISARAGQRVAVSGGEVPRFSLAGGVALAVAVYGLIRFSFLALWGGSLSPFGGFQALGLLPDALVNGLIFFVICRPLIKLTRAGGKK